MPSRQHRAPLLLVSTAAAVGNVLNRSCARAGGEDAVEIDYHLKRHLENNDASCPVLTAGLLLWNGRNPVSESCSDLEDFSALNELLERRSGGIDVGAFDELTTVGVSASVLRRLSLNSGAWVLVKETSTNVTKPARAVVLDPPGSSEPAPGSAEERAPLEEQNLSSLGGFPVHNLISHHNAAIDVGVAYLSPVLAFNLGLHASWLEFLTSSLIDQKENDENSPKEGGSSSLQRDSVEISSWCHSVIISPFVPLLDSPLSKSESEETEIVVGNRMPVQIQRIKYASHMRIGLIRVPSGSLFHPPTKGRQAEIDASLQDFFKVSRFLANGDIFSVKLRHGHGPMEAHNALYSTDQEKATNRNHLFFKVLALEPSTDPFVCVSHNHTALVLGGSVAAQLPPLTSSGHLHKAFLRTPVVRQLASLLAPCLHPRVPPLHLRIAVLIHGPTGSGKQTVVRLAAEDLGVHVVEFNCYDFVGASEGKTTSALMEAFKNAKRYSPSVLLLRKFEALTKSSSGGSSPGDQQGSVSRVTSALKTYIQAHSPNTGQEDYVNEDEVTNDDHNFGSGSVKFAGIGNLPKEGIVLVVAACESAENLSPSFRRCFTHEVAVGMPDEQQRLALLHHYLGRKEQHDVDESLEASLKLIASQTSGLTPRDLRSVAADTGAAAITRLVQNGQSLEGDTAECSVESSTTTAPRSESKFTGESYPSDGDRGSEMGDIVHLSSKDLDKVLERVKLRTASAIGTPKVPNVKWEDVGGLEDVKKAILDTVQLPLQHRELFASGLRQRSGVLLYGPPGTGKTLLAKAVATECSLNFLSVKGPELINMYIGESEKNVRDIFHKARAARPCVVFFDELDALAPARGASGDSGGVMDRVVSQLLAEIDGVSNNSQDLFIIGASNRPDLIDPALLRPGRFDKLLYVGISSENSYRERVLQALTRKFILDKNVSLRALGERCPVNYTGADMYALCADAWHQAVKREVSRSSRRRESSSEAVPEKVVVKQEDFIKAMGDLTPSLSKAELDRYERLRQQFQGQGQSQRQSSSTFS